MNRIGRYLGRRGRWMTILLLWLFWARLLHTAAVKSATFDEMFHILNGALYWQHTSLEPVVQNPPIVDAIIGLPVSVIFRPTLPLDHPTWSSGDWLRIAQAFLWQINDNGLQILGAGRLAIMSLALFLGALLYRWGRELAYSRLTGLVVLLLYSFDPNILAHSSLATADLGMALFLCLAAYLVWRYWRLQDGSRPATSPSRQHGSANPASAKGRSGVMNLRPSSRFGAYLLAAAGLGTALAAKFSGVVLLPAVFLLAAYRWLVRGASRTALKRLVAELIGWLLLAGLIFLTIYRFDLNALAADFTGQQQHLAAGHSAYLLGRLSQEGWWYYYPIVFAVKTPLPVLVLLVATLALFASRRRYDWDLLWPLLVAAAIGAASLFSRVNLGYRYLLPALPLLYLFMGQWSGPIAQSDGDRNRARRPALRAYLYPLLLLWAAGESLLIHPDYLAYFNQLAGGPKNGWRTVVDSNIDWGQDIQPLGRYLADKGLTEPVHVAWLGTAPLDVYDVPGTPLPAWPVASEEMLYSPFYPPRPAPGRYVLSVTQLQGVYLSDPDRFAWFQQRPPDDRVGYSLFVYDVPADGPLVEVALSGVGLATITPADFDQALGSNDVQPRWYDARRALLWPAGGQRGGPPNAWAVVGEGHLPDHPVLRSLYPAPTLSGLSDDGLRYHLFRWDGSPITVAMSRAAAAQSLYTDFGWSLEPVIGAGEWAAKRRPLLGDPLFGGAFQLLGYETDGGLAGESLTLASYWRVREPATDGQIGDLTIFVHLLDSAGQVVAQHDGLDISLAGLQAGDEWAQLHELRLPDGLPPGPYALQMGLYDAESGARLTVPTPAGPADRLLLRDFN